MNRFYLMKSEKYVCIKEISTYCALLSTDRKDSRFYNNCIRKFVKHL